uniref:t-SNARE coiled-coil homology domain-containing protein n=1 Tax=Globisporangium ultimum (strain ATCC 200006 / CBS 805.95 / DAOM BR144) TaxID=431595 RepID=K3WBG5_GLOUD
MGDFAAAASANTIAQRSRHDTAAARTKETQSLRAVAESLQIARETAHTLSMQSEQLDRSKRAAEDTQYAVDLSKRVLRGMTWSGWLYNAMSSVPQQVADRYKPANAEEIAMGFICPECKVKFNSPEQLGAHYANAHDLSATSQDDRRGNPQPLDQRPHEPSIANQQQQQDLHEDFLRALEPQLAELKEMSLALGNALDSQNSQLERLDEKIDTAHDGMKKVSIQAKKLAGAKLAVNYRFRCAFQEIESRKFLRDVDGEALLSADIVTDGCTFRAYTLGDGTEIWGFQSEKSSLFFGVNRYGNLKVKGVDLKSYEQFAIDHTKATTAILCVSSFFGLGGWIVRRESDNKLSIIRGTSENKIHAAQFQIVHLDEITDSVTAAT